MAGEINRVPYGLLSLLDMKARGQNPRTLNGELVTTVDMLDLYLLQERRALSDTQGVNAVSTYIYLGIRVPENEIWYIHRIICYPTGVFVGAGGAFNASIGWVFGPGQRGFSVGVPLPYTAGELDLPVLESNRPFWAKGGDFPALYVHRYTPFLADPTLLMEVQYTALIV